MSIGNTIDRFNEFELLNIPIGAAVYYKAIEQITDFTTELIDHFVPVPPAISGLLAAWLFRLPAVENFLGQYGSYYASMAAAGSALDETLHISDLVKSLLGKVEGEVEQKAVPSSTGSTSGYELPSNNNVGELTQEPTTGIDADLYEEWMNQNKIQGM